MGVQGLWHLLEPLGRPISLESLENKVLAVDASIWLHQAVHGFRDKSGNPLPNSHLIGIFHRLCKLLSYRIKPVFVFDGTVPLLKRETMAARRERQKDAVQEAEKSRKRILTRHMKLRAIEEVMKTKDVASSSTVSSGNGDKSTERVDLYDLPPIPRPSSFSEPDSPLQLLVSSEDDDTNSDFRSSFEIFSSDPYQDLDNVDVESDDFNALTLEIQHEILVELKEKLKRKSWTRLAAMPDDPEEIGKHQIRQLLIRRKVQKKLDEVGKRMGTYLSERMVGDKSELLSQAQAVEIRRIVSEDSAHYVLFKTVSKKYNDDTNISVVGNAKSSTTLIDKSSSEVDFVEFIRRKKEKSLIIDDLLVDKNVASSEVVMLENAKHESVAISIDFDEESKSDGNVKNSETKVGNSEIEFTSKETGSNEKVIDEWESIDLINEKLTFADKKETECNSKLIELKDHDASLSTNVDEFKESTVPFESIDTDDQNDLDIQNRLEPEPTSSKKVLASPKTVTICDEDSDEDFVEVDSFENVAELSPVSDELFPLEVFKKEMETDVSVPLNIAETEHDSVNVLEKFSDAHADETPFIENTVSMNQEELKLLSEQLEQEVETLVQEKGRQERVAATITAQMYVEIQELLKMFGVPYVVSPAEAEAQCATLDVLDLTEGTITDDSDIWLFGGRRVYKNFFNHDKDVFFFKDVDIKQRFGLDRRKLIAVALLTGSDYTEGIKGIGTVSALEVLAEFGGEDDGIDALKRFRVWWDETQNKKMTSSETKIKKTLRSMNLHGGFPSAVVVNAYMEPIVDSSKELFSWAHPDLDELRHFASVKLGWSKDKLDGMLLPVIKRMNAKESQRHMSDYFQTIPRDLPSTSKGVPSRRLQRAIKRVRGNIEETVLDPKAKAVKVLRSKWVSTRGRGKCRTRPTNTKISNDDSEVNLELSESSSGEEYIP